MKEEILEALSKPYVHTIKDINKATGIKRIDVEDILTVLKKDGYVYKFDNRYYLRKKGVIQIKDRGFGFIHVDGEDADYYVDAFNTKDAANGDIVDFYVLPKTSDDFLDNACVISVLERKNTHVFGKLIEKKNKKGTFYFVASHDASYDVKCFIKEEELNNAVPGAIVSAKITKYLSDAVTEGYIEKILGYGSDPGIDISLVKLRLVH